MQQRGYELIESQIPMVTLGTAGSAMVIPGGSRLLNSTRASRSRSASPLQETGALRSASSSPQKRFSSAPQGTAVRASAADSAEEGELQARGRQERLSANARGRKAGGGEEVMAWEGEGRFPPHC